jgi:hypothetical protein
MPSKPTTMERAHGEIAETMDPGLLQNNLQCQLGGYELSQPSHICAFFSSVEEEYDVLLPFIEQGFAAGGKAFHTIDPAKTREHLRRLSSRAIDTAACSASGQLDLRSWDEVHWRNGAFEPGATASIFAGAREQARKQGFSHTRFVSQMGWAAQQAVNIHDLLAYEASANLFRSEGPASHVVCVYNLGEFDPSFVLDVMRTHPFVLVGGTLYQNPLFVAPEEFLEQLDERARRP